jgi:hypothetical protein
MERSRRRSGGPSPLTAIVAIVAIAAIGLLAAWYRGTRPPAPPPVSARAPEPKPALEPNPELESTRAPPPRPPREPGSARPPLSEPKPEPELAEGPRPKAGRRSFFHTADPCRPVAEPRLPAGYDGMSAQGITLAWPLDGAPLLEPTAFAYLVAGLLEEAAQLTGTERRERLTVIFYASREDLHTLGGAPKWASGLYDGAVLLPAEPGKDFGVQMPSLRHEVMHAQLHTGAGCTPMWFNEGTAMYFSGLPPRRGWTRMLRKQKVVDFGTMATSTFDDPEKENVDHMYAQSLAMVLFMIDRSGESALKDAVLGLRAAPRADARRAALDLWGHLNPGVAPRDLLDSLARRMFRAPQPPTPDDLLRSAVCCYGATRLREFGCRLSPLDETKDIWVDESRSPAAVCHRD